MSCSNIVAHWKNEVNKFFRKTWDKLTAPKLRKNNNARNEKTNKVILLFTCVVITPFFINSIIGLLFRTTPITKVILLAIIFIPFISGWVITDRGYQKIGAFIPCMFLLFAAFYQNSLGAFNTSALLLYTLVNTLAAIMLDSKSQIFFMFITMLGFGVMFVAHDIGWLVTSQNTNSLLNPIGIAMSVLGAISIGVWFLKHQYQILIDEIRISSTNTRLLLETIIDGIVFSNLAGIIEDLNDAAIKIYKLPDKESAIGKNIVSFLSPEDKYFADALRDSMLNGQSTGSVNCTGLLPNGEKISLEINSALYFDRNGNPTGFVSTLRDVTQRKTVELELSKYREQLEFIVQERTAKLQDAYDELESFSYTVSHDLRSPLRGIDGYLSLVLDDKNNQISEISKIYMNKVKESAKRMGELITDLLDFSRLNRRPLKKKLINPEEIVSNIKDELLNGEYLGKPISLSIEELIPCEADPTLIRLVFYNLLDNAIKYSHKNERIIVKIGSYVNDKGDVNYFVKDNGIGFNMKYSEKLFGVFQRLHTEPDYEGTGIGLATAYQIIRRHNGKIWAESEEGKGSTFFFSL